jgi:feruloyl-CoA synthase
VFRGRLAEDFKLSTGTFVRTGAVRTALLSAIPLLSDAVIAGEDRDQVCALAWLNAAEAGRLLGTVPAAAGELVVHDALQRAIAAALAQHNRAAGSASRVERIAVLTRAADLDAGEITDKGYVNQRQTLRNRQELVRLLYTRPTPPGVITAAQ